MSAYVLDASVAAKWFLPADRETLTEESLRLLKGYEEGRIRLVVPDLFWPEFGNILWKAVRQRRISHKSAMESLFALAQLRITTAPTWPLLNDSFAIAVATDRTVYDCVYVALAIASNMSLLTADEFLANSLAARFPVRWLGSVGRSL